MSTLSTSPYDLNSFMNNYGFNPVGKVLSRDKKNLIISQQEKLRQQFIEVVDYEGLPDELNKDLIERILYFRGKGALFKYNERFWFLPFTLNGTIDSYGRYDYISPVVFTGQTKKGKSDQPFLPDTATNVKFKVIYDKKQELDEYSAVILTDRSLAISQDLVPMNELLAPYIEQLVDILVLVNIDLVTSAKMFYIVAPDEASKKSIEDEFAGIDQKVLNGQRVVVITNEAALELKELQGDKAAKDTARYFQSFQSVDNILKSIIGISGGGAFLKQEHMTDNEVDTNGNSDNLVLKNKIRMREEWADLAQYAFGLSITVTGYDAGNGDMIAEEGAHTIQQRGDE